MVRVSFKPFKAGLINSGRTESQSLATYTTQVPQIVIWAVRLVRLMNDGNAFAAFTHTFLPFQTRQ